MPGLSVLPGLHVDCVCFIIIRMCAFGDGVRVGSVVCVLDTGVGCCGVLVL